MELTTAAALPIAIYAMRPVLSVTSLPPPWFAGDYRARAVITNNGMRIKDVVVQCVSNKAIADDKYTLELHKYFMVNEYSVNNVASGESFTADCEFAWHLLTKNTDGLFVLGDSAMLTANSECCVWNTLGIWFDLKHGYPLREGYVNQAFVGYTRYPITGLDGSFIIKYKWPFSWFEQEKIIHMIARKTGNGVGWRVAPESEPVIKDAANQVVKIRLDSPNDDYSYRAKRTDSH